ncbi:MFS transporter [Acinetobacter haemolyticus]|uniref:MFS transporter n=1 Tax=Acinetobacter haemolyticus TaxID=29430 RepID=UPI003F551010
MNNFPNDKYKWAILVVATITQACACFFVQGLGAIAPVLQQDLTLTSLQIGLLVSSAQLAPLVGLLIAGELLDRYDERYVVSFGVLLVGLTLLLTTLFNTYLSLLILLFFLGFGYSSAQPGGAKAVSNWFPKNQLGLAMGIRQAGLPLGGALASLLLPFFAIKYGWHVAFIFAGFVAIFGAILFFIFYKGKDKKEKKVLKEINLVNTIKDRFEMLKEPSMFNIMLSGAFLTSVQYSIVVYMISYFYDELKISPYFSSLLLFICLMFGVIGRFILASWSDYSKSNRYIQVLCCIGFSIIGLLSILIFNPQNSYLLIALMAWLGFFGVGWYGPWVSYIADTAPKEKLGFALGLAMTANQLAVVIIVPLIGLSKDLFGSYTLSWIVLIVTGCITFLNTLRRNKVVLSLT